MRDAIIKASRENIRVKNEVMKQFLKEVRKPLWRLLCLIIPLCSAGWAFGLFVYFYWFSESYAQSCVWVVWCVFSLLVYKIKQCEL